MNTCDQYYSLGAVCRQRFCVILASGVATGCGPHRAALARGGKGAKNAENLKKITWKFRL